MLSHFSFIFQVNVLCKIKYCLKLEKKLEEEEIVYGLYFLAFYRPDFDDDDDDDDDDDLTVNRRLMKYT